MNHERMGAAILRIARRLRPPRISPLFFAFLIMLLLLAQETWLAGRTVADSGAIYLVVILLVLASSTASHRRTMAVRM